MALATLHVFDGSHVKALMNVPSTSETEYPFTHSYVVQPRIVHPAVGEVTRTDVCINQKYSTHMRTETPDVCQLYNRLQATQHVELEVSPNNFVVRVLQPGQCRIVASMDGNTIAGTVEHTYL